MNPILPLALLGAATAHGSHRLLTRYHVTVHKGWTIVPTAVLWALAGWRAAEGHLTWWWLPMPLLVAWLAVTLTVVDLKHRRLPNPLTFAAYPATAVTTLVATSQSGWHVAQGALLGALGLGVLYLTVHTLSPQSMGGGDVKLSGSQGAVLGAVGWPAVVVGATLAAVLTLLLNALAPRRHRARWRTGIPHAPALLGATYLIATFPAGHMFP